MGVRYKRRTKKGKSIPRVIEFVVKTERKSETQLEMLRI